MLRLVPTLSLLVLAFGCRARPNDPSHDESAPHRSFRFVYQARPTGIGEGAEQVRMWVPIPVDTPEQVVRNVRVVLTADDHSVGGSLEEIAALARVGTVPVTCTVADVGNGTGRSLCVATPGSACAVELSFDVTRYESRGGGKATPAELQRALQADSMVPLGGKASAMATGLEDRGDPMLTSRVLHDHTLERMRYDKPAGGEWGRGDAEWACGSRYGNCTDFHSYFMALARTKRIPTRFEMGFPVPAGDEAEARVGGYHCWAWFYAGDERGWVPVDISEADKHADRAEYFFGTIDENRVTMSGGHDLLLTPRPAAGALNFFVYPHVEVDGKPWSSLDKSFARVNLD